MYLKTTGKSYSRGTIRPCNIALRANFSLQQIYALAMVYKKERSVYDGNNYWNPVKNY